jgi:hypothetical protein
MPPALAPPPPTASAALVAVKSFDVEEESGAIIAEPNFPDGIDYDRWSRVVAPAPRKAFADRLDVLELDD